MSTRIPLRTPSRTRSRIPSHIATLLACGLLLAHGLAAQEPVPPPARPAPDAPAPAPPPATPPPATQQPGEPPPRPVPGDLGPEELARAMAETLRLAATGPQHEKLATLVGDWDVTVALTLPGREPETTTGRARAATILGGRYLAVDLTVPLRGTTFDGLYLFGYDRLRNLWSLSWRDSLSTWSIDALGIVDDKDAELVHLAGLTFDVASPTGREMRVDLAFGAADAFTISVLDTVRGALAPVMQQRFVRKDAAQQPAAGAGDGAGDGTKGGATGGRRGK